MSNVNFCPECGTKVEIGWNACPNCGFILKDSFISGEPKEKTSISVISEPVTPKPMYSYPSTTYVKPKSGNVFGIIALISGILGLCCFGIVFGIIALALGIIGQTRDETKGLATAGIVLGLIDLCCTAILFFLPFSLFPYIY